MSNPRENGKLTLPRINSATKNPTKSVDIPQQEKMIVGIYSVTPSRLSPTKPNEALEKFRLDLLLEEKLHDKYEFQTINVQNIQAKDSSKLFSAASSQRVNLKKKYEFDLILLFPNDANEYKKIMSQLIPEERNKACVVVRHGDTGYGQSLTTMPAIFTMPKIGPARNSSAKDTEKRKAGFKREQVLFADENGFAEQILNQAQEKLPNIRKPGYSHR